jgi:hypothetical protein
LLERSQLAAVGGDAGDIGAPVYQVALHALEAAAAAQHSRADPMDGRGSSSSSDGNSFGGGVAAPLAGRPTVVVSGGRRIGHHAAPEALSVRSGQQQPVRSGGRSKRNSEVGTDTLACTVGARSREGDSRADLERRVIAEQQIYSSMVHDNFERRGSYSGMSLPANTTRMRLGGA